MPEAASPLLGQVAALAAAACWAVAVTLFRGAIADLGARAVNLAKNAVATVLLGATVIALGQLTDLLQAPMAHWLLVSASGLFGLTLGDTALFAAVGRIGAPRALLLQSFIPVFTALLALAWLDSRPTPAQLFGGSVILIGVIVVVRSGAGADAAVSTPMTSRSFKLGLGLGLLGAFGQAAGIVLAKEAMTSMPIVGASFVRMAVGSIGLGLLLALDGRLGRVIRALTAPSGLARLVPPSILGTYVAFLLMMAGVAWAPAAIAAVLLATVPIWSLLIDAWTHRRAIGASELVGTLAAVAGVAIIALSDA